MKRKRPLFAIIALPIALVLLSASGCASSRRSRFFLLPATPDLPEDRHLNLADTDHLVGILPVRLASYLNVPQIVTRLSDEEIRFDEFNRWGMPLADGIAATLALRMLGELPNTYVEVYPWTESRALDYKVRVEILRFDGAPGKNAAMTARWTVTRGQRLDDIVARNISHYKQPVEQETYRSLARAMSRLVELLAEDIAATIRGLNDTVQPRGAHSGGIA